MKKRVIVMLKDMSAELDNGEFELLDVPRIGETLCSAKSDCYYTVVNIVHVGRNGFDTPYICVHVTKEN